MDESNIWERVLSRIETKVNRHSFYTWFKPASFLDDDGTTVAVRVPSPQIKDWLLKHYSPVLAEAMSEVGRSGGQVIFFPDGTERDTTAPPPDEAAEQGGPAPVTSLGGLNPRYAFDTFVVGPSNQFAEAACRAVAEAPSRSYNPLFIYGGVGLGKTHLMHAIGHYVLNHHRSARLTY